MRTTAIIFDVELSCLACGDNDQVTVGNLVSLPRMPQRCSRCGGSVLASSVASRMTYVEAPLNWTEGFPKRGRPLKSLSAIPLPLFEIAESA